MTVVKLSPWRLASSAASSQPLHSLWGEVDQLFDSFLKHSPVAGERAGFLAPRIDIAETDKEFVIDAELPGVAEKDIDVSVSSGVLTIRGEKQTEAKEEGKNYHRVERSFGSFQRQITLPAEIRDDKIEAEFKNGVLTIRIPKAEPAKPEVKKISVKTK